MLSNIAGTPGRGGIEALKGVGAIPVSRAWLHPPILPLALSLLLPLALPAGPLHA